MIHTLFQGVSVYWLLGLIATIPDRHNLKEKRFAWSQSLRGIQAIMARRDGGIVKARVVGACGRDHQPHDGLGCRE